jgi:hypothetical protein
MGADPMKLLRLYTALTRSCIEYEGFLFHSLTKGKMDMLERIQFKTIRLVFGYMRMTPKNVMLAETKIPPIIFRLIFLCSSIFLELLATLTSSNMIIATDGKGSRGSCEISQRKGTLDLHLLCRHRIGWPLIAKDVRPPECSFPYLTLLVNGSFSFKEGEEAKAIPDGSNRFNENVKT